MEHLKTFEFFDLNDDFGKAKQPTYRYIYDDNHNIIAIQCLKCNMPPSYNPNDIQYKFCGKCRKFHDEMDENFDHWSDSNNLIDVNKKTGVFEGDLIELDSDTMRDIPEIDHIITTEENEIINNYFKKIDGVDFVYNDVTNLNLIEAANKFNNNDDFEDEWLMNIILALYPEKYDFN